jgi:hypothetical protein
MSTFREVGSTKSESTLDHVVSQDRPSNQISPSERRWLNLPELASRCRRESFPSQPDAFCSSWAWKRQAAFALKPDTCCDFEAQPPNPLPMKTWDYGTRAIPQDTRACMKGFSLSSAGQEDECQIRRGIIRREEPQLTLGAWP